MRRWEFPKPIGGGIVIISYPFVLTPAPIPIRGALNAAGSVEIDGFDDTLLIQIAGRERCSGQRRVSSKPNAA